LKDVHLQRRREREGRFRKSEEKSKILESGNFVRPPANHMAIQSAIPYNS
jgi:hypothetical protein